MGDLQWKINWSYISLWYSDLKYEIRKQINGWPKKKKGNKSKKTEKLVVEKLWNQMTWFKGCDSGFISGQFESVG